jgi:predicted DNA-binding protein (MmcQ/YjbR family)
VLGITLDAGSRLSNNPYPTVEEIDGQRSTKEIFYDDRVFEFVKKRWSAPPPDRRYSASEIFYFFGVKNVGKNQRFNYFAVSIVCSNYKSNPKIVPIIERNRPSFVRYVHLNRRYWISCTIFPDLRIGATNAVKAKQRGLRIVAFRLAAETVYVTDTLAWDNSDQPLGIVTHVRYRVRSEP